MQSPEVKPAAIVGTDITEVGRVADQSARRHTFVDYRERRAAQTLRRQAADLALFSEYLSQVGIVAGDLVNDPEAWRGMTWGIIKGFLRWQLREGYAVRSVNVRLSTVKRYATLALEAGTVSAEDHALIRTVTGYNRAEGKRVNDVRRVEGIPTRSGRKKSVPVAFTTAQAKALKAQPADTAQGRRDTLLMCLLLDHGLRVSEVAELSVGDFDLSRGEMVFHRPKVDKTQTHRLSVDTLAAARAYFEADALAAGPLMRRSRKDGRLHGAGMTARRLTERVKVLGAIAGIEGLSAHDCRHYWATAAARNGTPIDRLMDAGGWTSPAMPLQYIRAAAIANEGVRLESE